MQHILVTGDFELPPSLLKSSEIILHLRQLHSRNELKQKLINIQSYILGGPEYLDDDLLGAAKNLKHIVVLGTGTPSFVDIKSANRRGIHIDNLPGINSNVVSEFALGMMISNNSNGFQSYASMRQDGTWLQTPWTSLTNLSIGLVGLGKIGQSLLHRLHNLGCTNMCYFSRSPKSEIEAQYGITWCTFPKLLQTSDIIVVHVNYTDETHNLFNKKTLEFCKRGARLFCFSNPKVINPEDLKSILNRGHKLSFVYMDGFYEEWVNCPGRKDPRGLLSLPPEKFVSTSHIAAQEIKTIKTMINLAWRKVLEFKINAV